MDSTEERWRPVPGHEDGYEASTHGRVRSLPRYVPGKDGRQTWFPGKTLRPWSNGTSGHLIVSLGARDRRYVHRIVLETFVKPSPLGTEACHADDDPTNNRLDNLRWVSRSENSFDRQRNGIDPRTSQTHCKAGHEFSEQNTHLRPGGGRTCKACRLRRKREENARKRQADAA